ncbi:T9SS C-terminal target domain-containing protein, partial [Dyadobacter luticola]
MTVELLEGSTVIVSVPADIYREDLKNNGTGTGNYGFSIELPSRLKDAQTHTLSIRIKGTSTLLTDSPRTLTCLTPSQYNGSFDGVDCNTVRGWVWDKSYPETALTVELLEGSTVHAEAVADIYREDRKAAGFGTGNYGFNFSLPQALKDGKAHQLSIRIKGTS